MNEPRLPISKPNEHGVLSDGTTETVSQCGRSVATIDFALAEDGLYRISVNISYGYGGFCSPIFADSMAFATMAAARIAGLEELLRRWPSASPSDPQRVHDELSAMRQQVESRLRQPSLF